MYSVARGSYVGGKHAESGDVVVELLLGRRRDLADRLVQRQVGIVPRRPRVDLVVDVGDVAHVRDVLRPVDVAEQPEQHVEHDDGARVADMGEVVDRRPAHVHAHVVRIDRLELGLLPGQRVIEFQRQSRLALSCSSRGRRWRPAKLMPQPAAAGQCSARRLIRSSMPVKVLNGLVKRVWSQLLRIDRLANRCLGFESVRVRAPCMHNFDDGLRGTGGEPTQDQG